MKFKTLIIIFLCFSKALFSQDTLRVETVVDSNFKTPQYVAAYDDVFLSHQETKWLFKADLIGLMDKDINNGYDFSKPIGLEFEHKLGKIVSVNIGVWAHLYRKYNFSSQLLNNTAYPIFSLSIEPRWYFNMKNLIARKKSENNLNGSYLSIRGQVTKGIVATIATVYQPNYRSITLNYGIQKRVLNNLFVDYRLGFGALQNEIFGKSFGSETPFWGWGFENDFTVGLAFGGKKKTNINACDLFRCFETEKKLWKFDIRNLLPFWGNAYISSALNTAYEFKFNDKGYWSLNTELGLMVESLRSKSDKSPIGSKGNLSIAPRYYYNLKKQIAKGLSVNNLSGQYLTTELSLSNQTFTGVRPLQSFSIAPKWGIQKRVFKNGFVDFSVAPYWYQKSLNRASTWNIFSIGKEHNLLKSDFKIGFAF